MFNKVESSLARGGCMHAGACIPRVPSRVTSKRFESSSVGDGAILRRKTLRLRRQNPLFVVQVKKSKSKRRIGRGRDFFRAS